MFPFTENQFGGFLNGSYLGNADLCGPPLTLSCPIKASESIGHEHGISKTKIIIICVVLVFICAIISILGFLIATKKWRKTKVVTFDRRIKLSAQEISRATNKYNDANIIGRGGSSTVYKGVLSSGMVIAVKKLNLHNSPEVEKCFLSESNTLGQIRHRNLVKIYGTLSSANSKCLILDYIPSGNLDLHLHTNESTLSWEQRFNIAHGVAQGLVYLHKETGFGRVLHCDLKPSNILLDEDFGAHISDFGIARMINSEIDRDVSMSSMQGSIGYVAPGMQSILFCFGLFLYTCISECMRESQKMVLCQITVGFSYTCIIAQTCTLYDTHAFSMACFDVFHSQKEEAIRLCKECDASIVK